MFHYVYQITNLVNNKIYIGVHSTENLNDEYMGSNTILSKDLGIYGRECFKKDIIEYFDTREEAIKREAELVNKDFVLREDTYNIQEGGRTDTTGLVPVKDKNGNRFMISKYDSRYLSGEYTHVIKGIKYNFSDEKKKERSKRISHLNKNTRKVTNGVENRSIKQEYVEQFLKDNPDWYYGQTQHWSEESKYKASKTGKHIEKLKQAQWKREHIDEIKQKHHEEVLERLKNAPKKTWVNNGIVNKKILKTDLEQFLKDNRDWCSGHKTNLSEKGRNNIQKANHEAKGKTNIILNGNKTKVFTEDLYKYPNAVIGWGYSQYQNIKQFDKNGNLIRIWKDLKEIDKNGLYSDYVSRCIRGLKKDYKGYLWSL